MPILEMGGEEWNCHHPEKLQDQALRLQVFVDVKTITIQIEGESNKDELTPSVEIELNKNQALFLKNFIDAFLNSNA